MGHYMDAWGYEVSLLVLNNISLSHFTQLKRISYLSAAM